MTLSSHGVVVGEAQANNGLQDGTLRDTIARESSALERSTQCIGCGYDLAGLGGALDCPECGHSVADSLRRSSLLRDANPRWLSRMATGLRLMYAAGVAVALAGVLQVVAWIVRDLSIVVAGLAPLLDDFRRIAQVVLASFAMAAYAAGAWLFGELEPRQALDRRRRVATMMLRATGLLAPVALVAWMAHAFGGGGMIHASISPIIPLAALGVVWAHHAAIARVSRSLALRCAGLDGAGTPRTPGVPWVWPGILACLLVPSAAARLGVAVPLSVPPGGIDAVAWLVTVLVSLALVSRLVPLKRGIRSERSLAEDDR